MEAVSKGLSQARRQICITMTSGTGQPHPQGPQHRSLYNNPYAERDRQYAVPSIRLRIIKGDAKGMTEDEVVLKTSLNLTSS